MYLSFTLENNTAVSYDGVVWTEYTEEGIMLGWESQRCSFGSQRTWSHS